MYEAGFYKLISEIGDLIEKATYATKVRQDSWIRFNIPYAVRCGAHVVDGCRLMVLPCRSYLSRVEP